MGHKGDDAEPGCSRILQKGDEDQNSIGLLEEAGEGEIPQLLPF